MPVRTPVKRRSANKKPMPPTPKEMPSPPRRTGKKPAVGRVGRKGPNRKPKGGVGRVRF